MRYPSIDVLRTLAIVVMVLVHFCENLSGITPPFAGLGAPMFALLSGVSYQLWVAGRHARGIDDTTISKISVRRGLFIFGVGFAFNILVWLPEDTYNWDVLTCVGVALLLLNALRYVPRPVAWLVVLLVLLVSPILRRLANYNSYWANRYFDPDLTLPDVLIGFFSTGYFPIFPWLAFSITGFLASSLVFRQRDEAEAHGGNVRGMVLGGAGLMLLSAGLLASRSSWPSWFASTMLGGWTMFPPTLEYVCGTLGLSLVLLAALHQAIDRAPPRPAWEWLISITRAFSQHSFTIYIVHHVVHLWPMWMYGYAQGHEPTYYWMKLFPLTVSIPLALSFLAACVLVFRAVGPNRNIGIESVMRWLCD